MGFTPCLKKSVSDIETQSESNIATQQLDDADFSFFGVSDGEEDTTAKKSKK